MPKICYIDHSFRSDTRVRIAQANEIIAEYQAAGYKLTLRQLYYQFVARDLMANSDKNYKKLGDTISRAREAGYVDWNAIEDRTRNLRFNNHWDDPSDVVNACADQFQLDKWERQSMRVEVWIEKDALLGVIQKVCEKHDVAYFSCRGYTSASEMWRAGCRLATYARVGQQPIILHLGDHDPSGIDMTRDIRDRLSVFAERPIQVTRIALNMDQILELNPPPNPAKPNDARYQSYVDEFGEHCWELDALDPPQMAAIVEQHILERRDEALWDDALNEENDHKSDLQLVADRWEDAVNWAREQ